MLQPSEERATNFEIALMGCWLIVSPLMLAFVTVARAAWPTAIAGALIAIFGFRHALRPEKEGSLVWACALLGVVVFLSPWIFDFRQLGLAFGNSLLMGLAVIYFASRSLVGVRRPLVEA